MQRFLTSLALLLALGLGTEAATALEPGIKAEEASPTPGENGASGTASRDVVPDAARRREEQERREERERLQAMESALLKLSADHQATQKSLEQMQQRVRAVEADRYANPLVYVLTFVCLLLAAALAAMWWLRRHDRAAAAWRAAQPAPGAAAPPLPDDALAAPEPSAPVDRVPAQPPPSITPDPDSSPPAPIAPAMPLRTPEPDVAIAPRSPMSANELIDLEQQAQFFVVLGQDEAAIDLLMGHVRSTGGVSPLPYLKLLEIYRRRSEREPYDRIRERFNRRFNAYAPEWTVDPELGRSLEGYPEVMKRLQDAWSRPSQAMELLDAALFRRDAGPTFDVPAYRELLFLYSTAHDLAERGVDVEGVDLLLPIGDEPASMVTSVPASAAAAAPRASFSLDLDVSTDQPPLEQMEFKRSKP
jgi:pilus assembly protein FimV